MQNTLLLLDEVFEAAIVLTESGVMDDGAGLHVSSLLLTPATELFLAAAEDAAEFICVNGVIDDISFASIDELELSGLKTNKTFNPDHQ